MRTSVDEFVCISDETAETADEDLKTDYKTSADEFVCVSDETAEMAETADEDLVDVVTTRNQICDDHSSSNSNFDSKSTTSLKSSGEDTRHFLGGDCLLMRDKDGLEYMLSPDGVPHYHCDGFTYTSGTPVWALECSDDDDDGDF